MNWEMLSVFIVVFAGVTILAFGAARWRQGDLNRLQEWGLAGRRFGTLVTWCLLGGDIYTAYTLIALPGFVFAFGAMGFYAIPYATIAIVFMFIVFPKFWTVARHSGYVTPADFVRERFDSPALALLVALTGIVATMPYIALQMYGMEVVIAQMGVPIEVSLIIAFVFLAAYTYIGGLRAPALIAIVKDICIWLVVLVAVITIPAKMGGFDIVFQKVHEHVQNLSPFQDALLSSQYSRYGSLIIGSALAIFLYPHVLTGVLSANGTRTVRRTSVFLLAFTFLLALVALLGFVAVADGITPSSVYGGANGALPVLFAKEFPGWFAGFSFAALAIGALAPAAIMSIAAANLFSRNIYREYIHRSCTERQEANTAKISSLVVKFGALIFILFGPTALAVNLQHMGNIWIIQTLPPVCLGLYTNWFHRRALIVGLLGGLLVSTWMLLAQNLLSSSWSPFVSISLGLPDAQPIALYAAIPSLIVNLMLCIGLTPIFRSLGVPSGRDYTAVTEFETHTV
jgi:SSS family solute:Na+ symporter